MRRSKSHLAPGLVCALILLSQATLPAQDLKTLNALYGQAQEAYLAQNYTEASAKLEQLIKGSAELQNAPIEMLRFSLGLTYFQGEKFAEAEQEFGRCAIQFPNGEFTSRCYLGIGQSILSAQRKAAEGVTVPEGQPAPAPDTSKDEKIVQAFTAAAKDPKIRAEAGLYLGRFYVDRGKNEEALKIFSSLSSSEVRTPQQTSAAVEAIDLMAQSAKTEDLIVYLNRLITQPGVRNSIAWYANQVTVRADELTSNSHYEAALAIYRSILPRKQIIEIQTASLERQKKLLAQYEELVPKEAELPVERLPATSAAELVAQAKSAIESGDEALKAITEKEDFDAALLLRRGRCLYYLNRYGEALMCFKYLQDKFPDAPDAEHAAYSQIVILNRLKMVVDAQKAASDFITKYPESDKREQVALLAGDGLAQAEKWPEVIDFYREMDKKYPDSPSRPTFIFYLGLAHFQLNQFPEAEGRFQEILVKYPDSDLVETALYRVAMIHFVQGDYKGTMDGLRQYLSRYPNGAYVGEAQYRLSFIDYSAREDRSDKIIKEVSAFIEAHPKDPSVSALYSLIGDVYANKKKGADGKPMMAQALEAYKNAAATATTEQILSYAMTAATDAMQANKDWDGLAKLHMEYYQKNPDSSTGTQSAGWVAKMLMREGKVDEAKKFLTDALKPKIADPSNEQVEFLLDELAKTFVPPGRAARNANVEDLCNKLAELLHQTAAGTENQTTNARIYYAQSRLANLLRDTERSNRFLRGIATDETDPASLSPVLLDLAADLQIKDGKLDQAEEKYRRLTDRYKQSTFADAGPAGLGQVELARGNFEGALAIFNDISTNNSATSRYQSVMMGKLKALVALKKLDEAKKLGEELLGDKRTFRGAPTGQILLILGDIYREYGDNQNGASKKNSYTAAHAYYQKAYVAYQAYPEICALAYWKAYEVLKLNGNNELATETLKVLATHPKLQKTELARKAKDLNP